MAARASEVAQAYATSPVVVVWGARLRRRRLDSANLRAGVALKGVAPQEETPGNEQTVAAPAGPGATEGPTDVGAARCAHRSLEAS
jgi:hypothetical protein